MTQKKNVVSVKSRGKGSTLERKMHAYWTLPNSWARTYQDKLHTYRPDI
jgi:hypothetical protein